MPIIEDRGNADGIMRGRVLGGKYQGILGVRMVKSGAALGLMEQWVLVRSHVILKRIRVVQPRIAICVHSNRRKKDCERW